jgi:Tol biopolymer transport system component
MAQSRSRGDGPVVIRLSALAVFVAVGAVALGGGTAKGAFPGANGTLAFVKAGDIWVANADGSNQTQLTTDPAADRSPRWSPDGTKIAFASNRDGDFEIFVMNADGGNQHQLTFNSGANDRFPTWTADGLQIVYDTDFSQIKVINADGSGGERLVTSDGTVPGTSPYGDKVVFSRGATALNLFTMHLDGSGLRQITNTTVQGFNASWSPTGNDLAFAGSFGNGTGDNDVFVMHANGTGARDLTNTPGADRVEFSPVWSPDGTKIAFDGCRNFFTMPDCAIYTMNANGSGETQIIAGMSPGTGAVDWQPIPTDG